MYIITYAMALLATALAAERAYAPIFFLMYICVGFNYYQHTIPARSEQKREKKGRRREDRRPLNQVLYISARIFIGVEMTREGYGSIQYPSSVFNSRAESGLHGMGRSRGGRRQEICAKSSWKFSAKNSSIDIVSSAISDDGDGPEV